MGGLRKVIKDNLPTSWEIVLRENKLYSKFIDSMYKSLPSYMRGNNFKDGVKRIKRLLGSGNPIYYCIDPNIDNINTWTKVHNSIRENEAKYK